MTREASCFLILIISLDIFRVGSSSILDNLAVKNLSEDGKSNFTELAIKYSNKTCEEYDVTTEDGYILKLFHIPGNKSTPVLLVHGIIDSSDTFIIRGSTSLAIVLAAENYDVWALNTRGNRYSRRHVSLNPDKDAKFWDFSLHENGYYDVPAAIDFVLNATGQANLTAVGHSQGTTSFFVLGSTRPEYKAKIKLFSALAPVAYLSHASPPLSLGITLAPLINVALEVLGVNEIFRNNTAATDLVKLICTQPILSYEVSYTVCMEAVILLIAGEDPSQLEPEFLPTLMGHYPTSTSKKSLLHFSQIGLRDKFAQYDYGVLENLRRYKSLSPPNYDLSKVEFGVALFAGHNDGFSSLEDVARLKQELGNLVFYYVLEPEKWNHLDYVWGLNMTTYLYPTLLSEIRKYN